MENRLTIFFDGKDVPVDHIELAMTNSKIEGRNYSELTVKQLLDCLVFYRNLNHRNSRSKAVKMIMGQRIVNLPTAQEKRSSREI